MQVAFRVDSSSKIGSGHLMRCLTLANALAKENAEIQFWCSAHPGNFNHLIKAAGYQQHELTVAQELDPKSCLAFPQPKLIVIDHYKLGTAFEAKLRKGGAAIMAIDDLADRTHDCDILLDQNLLPNYQSRYDSLVSNECVKLLGPSYVLLREQFYKLRSSGIKNRNELKRLFLFFGGSDQLDLTSRAVKALLQLSELKFIADVVVGSSYPFLEKLKQNCEAQSNISLHVQIENIAELMQQADLAIGTGGSSNWERCILGLPSLLTTVAENQLAPTKYLDHLGGCLYLGSAETITADLIAENLRHISEKPGILSEMSKKAASLVSETDCPGKVVTTIKELLGR